ncbi:45468_t:CDS:2, partial [Gigaspora margarita]
RRHTKRNNKQKHVTGGKVVTVVLQQKVLKDDKEKAFVLEYSGRKGKVVGKEKVQKIKNCREKERLLGEEKVVRKRKEKKRREDYREGYYQRGCNCQK